MKILVIASNYGVWAEELQAPWDALNRAGHRLTLATYLGLVLGPLGTAGLVIVFVVFMLLEREDLRDRVIRLVSRGKYRVYEQPISSKLIDLTIEHYSNCSITSTVGLRKLTIT